jgi:hypothetical protein
MMEYTVQGMCSRHETAFVFVSGIQGFRGAMEIGNTGLVLAVWDRIVVAVTWRRIGDSSD